MKAIIRFEFKCPCLETWQAEAKKPKMTGFVVTEIDCPSCSSHFWVKLRCDKKKKGKLCYEMNVFRSEASEKLTRILQLRAMTKFKSPARWKEEIKL